MKPALWTISKIKSLVDSNTFAWPARDDFSPRAMFMVLWLHTPSPFTHYLQDFSGAFDANIFWLSPRPQKIEEYWVRDPLLQTAHPRNSPLCSKRAPGLRAVVVTGRGRAFSAGGDVAFLKTHHGAVPEIVIYVGFGAAGENIGNSRKERLQFNRLKEWVK